MTAAEATPELDRVADRDDVAFVGHPKGLAYLCFAEGCERFSYYSMQTLLVLYMTKQLLLPGHVENIAGFGMVRAVFGNMEVQPLSSAIFGTYAALVYFTPVFGGMLADGLVGRRRTVALGAILMSIGHFLMAFEQTFLLALLALVLGVGCFKGNIASQVGSLYAQNDLRRAMAFQIFYIFINVSVIAAPLVSGTLGEKVGWHWGFGTAGVMMVVGLVIYLSGGRWLPAEEPRGKEARAERPKLSPADWGSVMALVVLIPILAIALLTNMEIFNAYLVWGDEQFNLTFFGYLAPTSWLITVDAALSFSMLVAVAAFWRFFGARGREPDELGKMIIGSFFTISGGLCLFAAAALQGPGEKIGVFWPLMFHLLNSIGFAHILPVSLALFSKMAPRSINATVVSLSYFSFFGANALVGKVGGLYSSLPTTTFWLIHVASAVVGLVAFVIFKVTLGDRMQQPQG
ncbi:MAG: peptide MFS transporter [Alphaproteobacteria bacterium]|nr:MAG: peptide MFS transporter [Alphaproteobacteria bacterium]